MTDHSVGLQDFYLTEEQPCPYLPGRMERKLFTRLRPDRGAGDIDDLMKKGFRRSQNIAYQPHCQGCEKCVSVRVLSDVFEISRNQKRVWRRNRDLLARRCPAISSPEQYRLFRDYIDARHGDGGMADMTVMDYMVMVEDSVVDTFVTEYRLPGYTPHEEVPREIDGLPDAGASPMDETLVAVALCDQLSDGISLVYSFFDPRLSERSLGTYIILEHLDFARRRGLPFVYLGYWVDGSRKMDYKTRFRPQQHLTVKGWRLQGQGQGQR